MPAGTWSDRGLVGLSLLQADFTTHEYAPHSHDGSVIAITENGGAIIRSGRETVEARQTVLFISNPAEPQSAQMGRSQRWRYRSLYLSDPALSQVARNVGMTHEPRFARSAVQDPELCRVFLCLHRALVDGCDDRIEQNQLLAAAFGRLFERHAVRKEQVEAIPGDRSHLNQVLDIMKQRFQDSLELADLADVAGLTQFQLIRLFRRVTGLTPHAYLVQLRLNAARHRLSHGAALAEAAVATGFYDQSALTKALQTCLRHHTRPVCGCRSPWPQLTSTAALPIVCLGVHAWTA